MNTKLSRSPAGRTPNLPVSLRASVGADGGGGRAPAGRIAPPPPQLSAGVGWEAHPNASRMQQMAVAVGAQGIGGDMASNPQKCIPGYPQSVVDSMSGLACPPDQIPSGVDTKTAQWIMAQIDLAKYATSPTRLGWLCDSITLVNPVPVAGNAPVIAANAAFGAVNVTPTRSFTMDALVMASGTANDPLFFLNSLTYQGTNYVGTGPWISTLFTPTSGCCLCVRVIPIIEKNTAMSFAGQNGTVANVYLFLEMFGFTLFSGSP